MVCLNDPLRPAAKACLTGCCSLASLNNSDSAAEQSDGARFFDTLLQRLDLSYACAETDRHRIPHEVP